jgi:hypothetical protein
MRELVSGLVWIHDYPVRYGGMNLEARTTLVRLASGELWVHSPGPIDAAVRVQVDRIGQVAHVVAPGTFHHLHVAAWARAYPEARVWLCPGLRDKRPQLPEGQKLSDEAPAAWRDEFDQVVVRGNRVICEVMFCHRPSRTLIVTDAIELYGDRTDSVPWLLKLWWRIFRMWNRPAPAPEYAMGWRDRQAARRSFETALGWDFERIVLSHGDLIEQDAHAQATRAWQPLLGGPHSAA